MASNDIQARLQREVAGAIAMLNEERATAISCADAEKLCRTARDLMIRLHTAERALLVVQTALIWSVAEAAQEPPGWERMVRLGTGPEGEVWFEPQLEVKPLYALLLTNNAIARSLCGVENATRYAAYVAETAVRYFNETRGEGYNLTRWEAAALVVQARQATDPRAKMYYARGALQLLNSCSDVTELYTYAKYLAGVGNGKVYDSGVFGTRLGRRARSASLGVNDLFRFNR